MNFDEQIFEVHKRTQEQIEQLLSIWEQSVRATHVFLSDEEIQQIKEHVPQAIRAVEHLILAENETGEITAFMGIAGSRLEMLFLLPSERGRGLGKRLLQYGIMHYGIREVTVNEQNPHAVGFYQHMGFETYKRTEYDEEGNPYPLLYMKQKGEE